jgi:hypothetical protein
VQDFALKPPGKCPEAADTLARQALMLFKRRPEPDVAAELLMEAGLLHLHEPLPLLRAGRSFAQESEFHPSLEAAAQVMVSCLLDKPLPLALAASHHWRLASWLLHVACGITAAAVPVVDLCCRLFWSRHLLILMQACARILHT